MFNKKDYKKNAYMLTGKYGKKGYDWWWHSFTASDEEGNEKPFFIEFFIINPKLSPAEIKFGRLGMKPSYLMVKCGCWGNKAVQLHRFFKLNDVKINKCPYKIEAGDCYLDDTTLKGKVSVFNSKEHKEYMCDDGSMEFDLKIEKDISFNVGYGTSPLLRKIKAFEMYWHAEGIKSRYSGTVIFNGKKYNVIPDKSYGYQDKNWGSNFTSPWLWLASSNIYSNISHKKLLNTAFDIGGGRPKIFFLPLDRKLLGVLYLEGKEYEFNFSKFWHRCKTAFDVAETDEDIIWHVKQQAQGYIMETNIRCHKKDMLLVNYEAPNGLKLHNRLWNGGNGFGNIKLYKKKNMELIEDLDVKNVGCEYGEYDKK